MWLINVSCFDRSRKEYITSRAGFTLIETLMVIGIIAVVSSFGGLILSNLAQNTVSVASEATLTADLRQQQLKSQQGFAGTAHGIAFGSGEYVLFQGTSYDQDDPTNQVFQLEEQLTISTTLPGNVLLFAALSGEPVGISEVTDQITVMNSSTGDSFTIEINPLGVPLVL